MSKSMFVIVGAGIAGISAADALRRSGYKGGVVIVDAEPIEPYDRPPLSKGVLTAAEVNGPIALRPAQWYQDNQVDLLTGRSVEEIDRSAHNLRLDCGQLIHYDRLLIATGSKTRKLPTLEIGPLPCLYLRTHADALQIRDYLGTGRRVAVVGAGVIGLEVAASAQMRNTEVAVVEMSNRVMSRSLAPSISNYVESYHRRKGVALHLGSSIVGQGGNGALIGLELQGGQIVPADVIVVGVGILPNSSLAQKAGLTCDDGVVIDEFGVTSDADIFAAGDVTRYPDSFYGRHVRCENWMHAEKQAAVVARNMMGERVAYRHIPFMWSDQFDLKIQVTGLFDTDRHVLRGSMDNNAFVMFHLRNGQLVGATAVNQPRDITITQKLIESRVAIEPERLADINFNLRSALPK